MSLYIGNPKETKNQKQLEPVSKFIKIMGYKINIQILVVLYIYEHKDTEINDTSFIITQRKREKRNT